MQVKHVFSGFLTAAVLCAGMDVAAMQATKQPAATTTAAKPTAKAGFSRNQKLAMGAVGLAAVAGLWNYQIKPRIKARAEAARVGTEEAKALEAARQKEAKIAQEEQERAAVKAKQDADREARIKDRQSKLADLQGMLYDLGLPRTGIALEGVIANGSNYRTVAELAARASNEVAALNKAAATRDELDRVAATANAALPRIEAANIYAPKASVLTKDQADRAYAAKNYETLALTSVQANASYVSKVNNEYVTKQELTRAVSEALAEVVRKHGAAQQQQQAGNGQ